MRIIDQSTVHQNISDTVTIQNMGTMLGNKPHMLNTVVTMYDHLSITTLTEALINVYYNKKQAPNSFTPINSMSMQWKVNPNKIKRVKIVGDISGAGVGKLPVSIKLEEKYFNKHDVFALENGQMLRVTRKPVKLTTKVWDYTVVITGNSLTRGINLAFAAKGKSTRYISNHHPEMSTKGYRRYTTNTELHRNYLTLHREEIEYSGSAAILQDVYLLQGDDLKNKDAYCKLNEKEKMCLDAFLETRENSSLFSETNYDINGKCLDQEEDGRDIPMGDGVITQIERCCNKYSFSVLTADIFDNVMQSMRDQSTKSKGNIYAVICNERLYTLVGRLMRSGLNFMPNGEGASFYSKAAGDTVKVGGDFNSYTFQGNTLNFMPDRSLSSWKPNGAYGIFLDTSADTVTGSPNVSMFTLEGADLISGNLHGMGGDNGKSSGVVSSMTHGGAYGLMGYSGAVIFNPYAAFILEEAVIF